MLLLLPTAAILECPPAAILEISVTSEKRRGKLCHLISIVNTFPSPTLSRKCQSSHFLFCDAIALYSSGGHSNMAAVGFDFPTIDARLQSYFSDQRLNYTSITPTTEPTTVVKAVQTRWSKGLFYLRKLNLKRSLVEDRAVVAVLLVVIWWRKCNGSWPRGLCIRSKVCNVYKHV